MLFEGAIKHEDAATKHQYIRNTKCYFFPSQVEFANHRVESQVCVVSHGDNGTQECDPNEQKPGQFLRADNAIVEAVAQNHIAKHHDDHGRQHDDQG